MVMLLKAAQCVLTWLVLGGMSLLVPVMLLRCSVVSMFVSVLMVKVEPILWLCGMLVSMQRGLFGVRPVVIRADFRRLTCILWTCEDGTLIRLCDS